MPSLLLQGGTVLIHGADDQVTPTKTDVLVQNDRITKIETSITPPDGCDVIDCTEKIISPGFVDTHHHMWQSPLKGLFGDSTFMAYMGVIVTVSQAFDAKDFFWANLAGTMEAIDAGTTTALDHAHMNFSPEHSKQALAGTLSSGIRSIFAYTPSMGIETTKPKLQFWSNPMPDWVMETFEQLATAKPITDANSRVKMGLGFDFWFLPEDFVKSFLEKVRSLGGSIVTGHCNRFRGEDSPSLPAMLKKYGLLDHRIVLSHAGGATAEDATLLKEANAFVSVTPSSEQHMAVGPPVCFRDDLPGMDKVCSFGVDSQGITGGSIVSEMRIGLQSARGKDSAEWQKKGKLPRAIYHTTLEAYNMGTVQGARALNMQDDIGSIAVGKKADLVVFDTLSPAMIGVAQKDPVMAIVLHSSIGDIDTVVVDGVVRKRGGKLLPVQATEWTQKAFAATSQSVEWREVATKILEIQGRFVKKLEEYDLKEIESTIGALYHLPW